MRTIFSISWLLLTVDLLSADVSQSASWNVFPTAGGPQPNSELPKQVQVEEGKLSLFADFHNWKEGQVPVYLVNRTAETVRIPCQDRDIYLKLERLNQDGGWERAQTHRYSFCGNSYFSIELMPGHHLRVLGYMPEDGEAARVRFQTYGTLPLVSNAGTGVFLEKDLRAAELDDMALRIFPRTLREVFESKPGPTDFYRKHAPAEKFVSALRLAGSYVESPYVRSRAKDFLDVFRADSAGNLGITREIQETLDRSWPKEADAEGLARAALREHAESPLLALGVLHDLLQEQQLVAGEFGDPLKFRIAEHVLLSLQRGNMVEKRWAARLLGVPHFADTYFKASELESLLRTQDDPFVLQAIAFARVRRGSHESCAELGNQLPRLAQPWVVAALASDGLEPSGGQPLREPDSEIERGFWIRTAMIQPVETVRAIYYPGVQGNRNRFSRILHEPLRNFLLKQTTVPSSGKDGWEIGRVVSFVAAWEEERDIPIFKGLLTHPAVQRSEVVKGNSPGKRFEYLRYRVREEARRALLNFGEDVPEDLVLREERVLHPSPEY